MSRHYQQAPKPYDFVPIATPRKKKTVGHERIRGEGYVTGRLTYRLRVLTPVFVASGTYALGEDLGYDEPVVRSCYRINDVPAIPGSSLKGVVRSIAEAISPSCVTTTRLDRRIPHQPRRRDECTPEQACPACSIFGRMGRMSKVFFGDARLARGGTRLYRLPALYAPRAHQKRAARRWYENDAGEYKGRKFYYHGQPTEDTRRSPVEVIPKGSFLIGAIDFENLTAAELGLLFFALGLDGSIALKLGGGKPVCLGSLRVEPGEIELVQADHFLQAEPAVTNLDGEDLVTHLGEKMQTALQTGILLVEQAQKLREILQYPHDHECPDQY